MRADRGRTPFGLVVVVLLLVATPAAPAQDEPPALNPFGPRTTSRDDALPGCAELSDGTLWPGRLHLTRDVRLKIYDQQQQRQREVPLRAVRSIECAVEKQWMEKEWRFKENASDEKVYTGRQYPVREYRHTITLQDGRRISGPLSGILYVRPYAGGKTQRVLMHKRQKGAIGSQLDALVYLQRVDLGDDALRDGVQRSQQQAAGAAPRRPAAKR